MPQAPTPTRSQLRELRRLAEATGTSFIPPITRAHASRQIADMRDRPRSSRHERTRERRQVSDDLQRGTLASAPQPDEIHGYGSSAHWANNRPPEAA
jgi:hypothetical protein